MKVTYEHLNKAQGEQLNVLVKLIAEQFQPERIVCFGIRIHGYARYHCFAPAEIRQTCDFCLLVIMPGTQRREHELQDYVNTHFKTGAATLLCHGSYTVQAALQLQNYFFATVLKNGVTLHLSNGSITIDEVPEIDLKTFHTKAIKQFNDRMAIAANFLDSAEHKITKNQFALCAFMLHQSVEQACSALIYLYMGYRIDIHHIGRLLNLCASFTNELDQIFLKEDAEDKRLLTLLQNSYTDARYGTGFNVAEKDTAVLYGLAEVLLEKAAVVGRKKIELNN